MEIKEFLFILYMKKLEILIKIIILLLRFYWTKMELLIHWLI